MSVGSVRTKGVLGGETGMVSNVKTTTTTKSHYKRISRDALGLNTRFTTRVHVSNPAVQQYGHQHPAAAETKTKGTLRSQGRTAGIRECLALGILGAKLFECVHSVQMLQAYFATKLAE